MADHPPVPDPTTATTKAELLERLQALAVWADQAPLERPVALGATGWLEARVVACLRARQWSADAIDRELGRWRSAVEAIERPTAEYPVVAPPPAAAERPAPAPGGDVPRELDDRRELDDPRELDTTQEAPVRTGGAGLDDPTAVLPQVEPPAPAPVGSSPEAAAPAAAGATTAPQVAVPPGAAPAPGAPPPGFPPVWGPGRGAPPGPWRWMGSRRVAALAGLVVLALIVTPAIVARVGGSSAPAASASPTGNPVESIAASEQASPESAPRGQLDTEGMRPATPSPAAEPDDSAPSPPSPTSEPEDEPSPDGPWSTIVDNTDSGRFRASGDWSTASDSGAHYGANFRYASPVEASDPAWYRIDIPETGRYRVDAWFPAAAGYNDRAPYIVVTTGGNQTVHISQQSNGGRWMKLGTFEIAGGDAEVVAVSRWRTAGTGRIVADAIRVTATGG